MNLQTMLSELRTQREQIDDAIAVLARIAEGRHGKRRGRKPKWMTEAKSPAPKRKGRTFTAAQRKAASERMKKRWAAKRKAKF